MKNFNTTFEINGWRISDLPVQLSREDYNNAQKEITLLGPGNSDLIAIFLWGNISYPGISDMDCFAVFDNDAKKMFVPVQPLLTERAKYILKHEILMISEKHYKKMLFFDPWTTNVWPDGHKLLYQKHGINRNLNYEPISFNPEEKEILSVMRIQEQIFQIFNILPLFAKKEMPIRHVLENLKTLVYMSSEINNIGDCKVDTKMVEQLKKLMTEWFDIEQKEAIRRLIPIFKEGLILTFEIAFAVSDWASRYFKTIECDKIGIRKTDLFHSTDWDEKGKILYLNTFKTKCVYSDLVKTADKALELSLSSCSRVEFSVGKRSKSVNYHVVFLPFNFSSILLGMVNEKGLLSDALKKDIFTNQKYLQVFNPPVYRDKIGLINEITETYNNKQSILGGGKGYLYGNNLFDYSFGREKIRRKIFTFWLKRKFWSTATNKAII